MRLHEELESTKHEIMKPARHMLTPVGKYDLSLTGPGSSNNRLEVLSTRPEQGLPMRPTPGG